MDLNSLINQKEALQLAFEQALTKENFARVKVIYLQLKEVERQIHMLKNKTKK